MGGGGGDLHWLLTNKYITLRVHSSLMLHSSNCVEEWERGGGGGHVQDLVGSLTYSLIYHEYTRCYSAEVCFPTEWWSDSDSLHRRCAAQNFCLKFAWHLMDWTFTSVADVVTDNINSVSVIDSWTWMWTVHPINFLQIVQGEPRYSSEASLKSGTCRATLAGLVKLADLVSNPEAWRSKD